MVGSIKDINMHCTSSTLDKRIVVKLKTALDEGVEFSPAETQYIEAAYELSGKGIPLSFDQSVAITSIKMPK